MTDAPQTPWPSDMRSPLDDKLGVEISELSPERAVGSMPVEGNTQPYGLLHGGASAVLVESLGSMAAGAYGQPDRVPVGVDINVTHLRPALRGRVTGTATAVHLGGSTAVYSVELRDDEGNPTAVGRITCRLIKPRG